MHCHAQKNLREALNTYSITLDPIILKPFSFSIYQVLPCYVFDILFCNVDLLFDELTNNTNNYLNVVYFFHLYSNGELVYTHYKIYVLFLILKM